ncbi:hypothetical protein [Victivallis sp. Marseille-Q1083]|uniref:hypothetical protein n=1 Tax=Victivallis sp. Marseille-Q1083 TaxID=2717288 RepID=UPI0015899FE7|nr:hypothetical protein [Victivallis sp. Marseille-Q1083]
MKKKILFVLLLLFSYIGGLITSYYFSLYRYKEIYKSEIARLSVGYDLEVKNAAEKEVTDIEILGEKEIKVERLEPLIFHGYSQFFPKIPSTVTCKWRYGDVFYQKEFNITHMDLLKKYPKNSGFSFYITGDECVLFYYFWAYYPDGEIAARPAFCPEKNLWIDPMEFSRYLRKTR